MCADKHTLCRNFAQHGVQHRAVASALNGIYPHQHTIELHELPANFVTKIVVINDGFRVHS
jgi:hypothetical protein